MTAIVLAGQRDGENELAQFAGVDCKALAAVGGKPMLLRVLETLLSASSVGPVVLCGPDRDVLAQSAEIDRRIRAGDVSWLPPKKSPSTSAYAALKTLPAEESVLLTTADHPLLTADIVETFCRQSIAKDADITIGLAPYSRVRVNFPTMKKTITHFRDDELCGCNLFMFLTPESREAANFWRQIETQRKKPLRLLRMLGWLTVASYLLGRLSLGDALDALGARLGVRVRAVILDDGDAAVDVDSVSDYRLVSKRFAD